MATYRYQLDTLWRGEREPTEAIRKYVVIFDGHLPMPMPHVSKITISDGNKARHSEHVLSNRLHFDSETWTRQFVHRLSGYTECQLAQKPGVPAGTSGLNQHSEEDVVQAVTVAFQILCDWVIYHHSTATTEALVIRSLPLRETWSSNYPFVTGNSISRFTAEPLLRKWYESLSARAKPNGWDMRARVVYSILKNEQAKAEIPTQLLVMGAGIETIARKYFKSKGFDPKPALQNLSHIVTAIRSGSIPDVPTQFGDRVDGFRQLLSNQSAKDRFRAANSGSHLDFTESEVSAWGNGRNLSAHVAWPGPDDGIPYLLAMLTMMHKALLRTIDWNLPLTDYAIAGWPLIEPHGAFPVMPPRIPASSEQRRLLIAEAAYFRYHRGGFRHGNDIEDWIAAELEVDKAL